MSGLLPKGLYIVIDTAENRLYLKNGKDIVRTAVVSCGSGVVLEEPGGKKRSWVFDTPRGEFNVKSKITNPYWVKPDWAFIEEGEAIPKGFEDRIEAGTLGDYALGFGEGLFHPRYALHAPPGQERHPRLRPGRGRGPQGRIQGRPDGREDLHLLRERP